MVIEFAQHRSTDVARIVVTGEARLGHSWVLCVALSISACHGGDFQGAGAPCGPNLPCRPFFSCVDGSCRPAPDTSSGDADPPDTAGDTNDGGLPSGCSTTITDLSALLGTRVRGRLEVVVTTNPTIERLATVTPRDWFVLLQREGQHWTMRDLTADSAGAKNPDGPCFDPTVAAVGNFGTRINGDLHIEFWNALGTTGEFLSFLRIAGQPWSCLDVSSIAQQRIRGAPVDVTNGSMALGPEHRALLFRFGGFPPLGDGWKVRDSIGSALVGSFAEWHSPSGGESLAGLRDDGTIAVFRLRPEMPDTWVEDSAVVNGTPMRGDVIAWKSRSVENLAATSESRHLFVFSHSEGSDWKATDVTLLDGETAQGRPARHEIMDGMAIEEAIAARNEAGQLIYHHRDAQGKWRAFDVSCAARGEELVFGDPAGWAARDAAGAAVEALAAEGSDGRLLLFEGFAKLRSSSK